MKLGKKRSKSENRQGDRRMRLLRKIAVIALILILIGLLILGREGAQKSYKISIKCDIGVGDDGDILCWKWRNATNNEMLNEIFRI